MKLAKKRSQKSHSTQDYFLLLRRSAAIYGFSVATGLTAANAGAQEPDAATSESDNRVTEVLVEGQAVGDTLSDFAFNAAKYGTQVQSIEAEEIETGGFTNFGELAAGLIRGANIGYSPDEGEFTIRLDGGTDRDTLLLVDGVPTFDRGTPLEDIWGATAIDPRMIDSVEVFRGGQSVYYGGNGGLGVVNVRYKKPQAGEDVKGEIGFYGGDFKTRELYGNVAFPLTESRKHYLMFFGRSYETDAHEIFSESAYTDTVLALGGKHEFPYSYNLAGAKYLWAISDDTELRLSYQLATVDFRDSFPNTTVFQPNNTEIPIFDLKFKTRFSERVSLDLEGYFTAPKLKNTEVDARVCSIPRFADLPENIQAIAQAQGFDAGNDFATAAEFEQFAASVEGLPAGCVTNPYGNLGQAAVGAKEGYYVDESGRPYGTLDNPFPIGAPLGYVIQSTAGFGTGVPTKGFGEGDQFTAGYKDYGLNTRVKVEWSDYFETVTGVQGVAYEDNSDTVYGMSDDVVTSTGVYADIRVRADFLEGTNLSVAVRQDFNNKYDDQEIWKYGFRQNLPGGLYLRSNGGTSYSNPTLTEAGMRANLHTNPSLQPQQVETYSAGVGIDGDVFGGTFNFEVGYFDTVIDNLFGNAQLEDVCPNYVPEGETINPNYLTPEEFCQYAEERGLQGNASAYFNRRAAQDIEGITFDAAFDFNVWQLDFTFTDMESLEKNPIYQMNALQAGSGEEMPFIVPGAAGTEEFRQSAERPEWSASALLTVTPTERWVFALNPTWQGPEWAYGNSISSRLVDADGARTNPDLNFGDYFVLNGSVQYHLGDNQQHRFLLRAVNILDEDYFERASASADQRVSRAGVRGEIGSYDSAYYYQYGWNGKPRSFWLQYEYSF